MLSVLVMGALGLVFTVVGTRLVVDEALDDAEKNTRNMADLLASPFVDKAVRRGDPGAVEHLARVLDNRMRDGSITHIIVYDQDGLVLWSDNPAIRRHTVHLADDVEALFGTENSIVEPPGERDPHPWSNPGDADLIETYVGAFDADGAPFVFEAYASPDRLNDERDALLTTLLPYLAAVVLCFLLATLPLAIALARRVDRAAAKRSTLLAHSLHALEEDRQRVAQYLHDGVIQDLSAAGYTLTLLATPEPGEDPLDDRTRQTTQRLADLLQHDVRQLRTLVTDLFPDELTDGNLVSALNAVRDRGAERYGVDVRLEVVDLDDIDVATSNLVFYVVREAIANVGRHARATTASVVVGRTPTGLVVTVTDDGVGPSTAARDEVVNGSSHQFGLRLLRRQIEDFGGRLDLAEAPDGGAVLTATIPVEGAAR